MITLSNALAATADIAGFQLTVKPCSFWLNSILTTVPQTTVFLSPNTTNYFIYLNLASSTVGVNTTSFPSNSIPIATARTDSRGVAVLADQRPDFIVSGTGTGNTSITVTSVSTTTTLSNISSNILYVFATGGSGAGITITYPAVAQNIGGTILTKKVDSGVAAVTVSANLDGGGNYGLTNQNQYVSGASDGTNWWIVGNS